MSEQAGARRLHQAVSIFPRRFEDNPSNTTSMRRGACQIVYSLTGGCLEGLDASRFYRKYMLRKVKLRTPYLCTSYVSPHVSTHVTSSLVQLWAQQTPGGRRVDEACCAGTRSLGRYMGFTAVGLLSGKQSHLEEAVSVISESSTKFISISQYY